MKVWRKIGIPSHAYTRTFSGPIHIGRHCIASREVPSWCDRRGGDEEYRLSRGACRCYIEEDERRLMTRSRAGDGSVWKVSEPFNRCHYCHDQELVFCNHVLLL